MNSLRMSCAALANALILLSISPSLAVAREPPEYTEDGLKRIPDTTVDLAYKAEDADFSIYDKVLILDTYVAFRKNWAREHRTTVSSRDITRIKDGLSELFHEVFVEVLEQDGGYPVVTEPGPDVLILKPAIVDLDIPAPDSMSGGSSRTFSASPGSAKLYLEFFDGLTGDVLARVIDAKGARRHGTVHIGSSARNSAAARKALREWATLLRDYMDDVHDKSNE